MKRLAVFAFLLLLCCQAVTAQADCQSNHQHHKFQRKAGLTDSFDIVKYDINLDIRNLATKKISGYADIQITSKANGLTKIKLDLLEMQVNKISINSTTLTHIYNDTLLIINLDKTYNATENFTVRVEYEGNPQSDKQWGGFYFSGSYAFNLGVGFDANPHSFGRVWFPCLDNFVSKSLYKFSITTDGDKRALCNGLLTNTINNFDGSITWVWELNNKIPSYLASVAVAPYGVVNDTYNSINGPTPITLAALPSDTANMRASFKNIKGAFAGFEKWYGAHTFERVGFNAVPFNGGAMEHATNIAYPIYAIDGTLNQETLMAHEFSHHWWGDNITCRTPEDMWLNEGWASYSEKLFLEHVYGKERYKAEVRDNHYEVVRWAHLRDAQPRAVSGVPHAYTYGAHVYKKGADMVHTLRSYMGDAAFEAGVKDFQNKYKYKDVSSEDLKSTLQPHTTANLTAFFNNWIYTAGFPAFSAYIVKTDFAQGKYNCTVKVHQQSRHNNTTYTAVPLEIHFIDKFGGAEIREILLNASDTQLVVTLPINPAMVAVDRGELLSDAVTENELWLKNSGNYNFNYGAAVVNVPTTRTDSVLMRIEQRWTTPVTGANPYPGLYVSGSRYWNIDGTWTDSLLDASALIVYDGSTPGGHTTGWLDNDLIRKTEDSLVLLYRKDPSQAWQLYPYYQKTMGNTADKRGNINLQKIKKGEYVFAMYDKSLGDKSINPEDEGRLEIFPNPTSGIVNIKFDDIYKAGRLQIMDNIGRTIEDITLFPGQNFVEVDTFSWKAGIYHVSFAGNNMQQSGKLVVE